MYGEILNPIRKKLVKIKFFHKLLSCALCTGFWCGLFLSKLNWQAALYSAATCYILNLITDILSSKAHPDFRNLL